LKLSGPLSALNTEPAPLGAAMRLSYYPWLVVGCTCIGAFIGQVDASIVQLILPALESHFHANLSSVSWVATAYLLAYASLLPVFARLSEMFGRKSLYLAGYAVFAMATVCCGMAPSLRALIAFRVLQGVGGSLLGANSLTILAKAAGPARRGRAMGLFATAQAIGISLGPIVGGVLLSTLGWRWVFWVSVPFGVAALVAGWLILPITADAAERKQFDFTGALLLTPALTSIVAVLSEIPNLGLRSFSLLAIACAAMLLLPLFAIRERRASSPLVDLNLFRSPAFAGGAIGVVMFYALLYAMFFLMSFGFVRGLEDSPLKAGLRLAAIPIALGLAAPISGSLSEHMKARILTNTGMGIAAAALVCISLSLRNESAHGLPLTLSLALFGLGLGIFVAPNNSQTMSAAPENRHGQAGGLLNLTRALGCATGIAIASTSLSWRIAALSGHEPSTLHVSGSIVLSAVRDVLWVLGAFALIAVAVARHSRAGDHAPATAN
jgi:EmrB/QacA subfamily drug resistance transporter